MDEWQIGGGGERVVDVWIWVTLMLTSNCLPHRVDQCPFVVMKIVTAWQRNDPSTWYGDVGTEAVFLLGSIDAGKRRPVQRVGRRRGDAVRRAMVAPARGISTEVDGVSRQDQYDAGHAGA